MGWERLLTMCQKDTPPHKKLCLCFFHSITSNKPLRNIFIVLGGGWSSLRPCSKLQISLIRYSHVPSKNRPYFHFFGCARFSIMCWKGTPLIQSFFALFLASITSSKPIHFLKIFRDSWPSLRPSSKLQILLISYFHDRPEFVPILSFLPCARFSIMCQ